MNSANIPKIVNHTATQYTKGNLRDIVNNILAAIPNEYLNGIDQVELKEHSPDQMEPWYADYINAMGSQQGGRIILFMGSIFRRAEGKLIENRFLVYTMLGSLICHEVNTHLLCVKGVPKKKRYLFEDVVEYRQGLDMYIRVIQKSFPFRILVLSMRLQLKNRETRAEFLRQALINPLFWQRMMTDAAPNSILWIISAFTSFTGLFGFLSYQSQLVVCAVGALCLAMALMTAVFIPSLIICRIIIQALIIILVLIFGALSTISTGFIIIVFYCFAHDVAWYWSLRRKPGNQE
ncbi:MAG: hypothetical protein KC897_08370 [Candidatus Omnitrophica bacterium]|nr:hypothetical protein [Candidatus Omnitrophota bacterium]MCB9720378.1 hypothetical protein [Candidatus Omnitrophota bacterium]